MELSSHEDEEEIPMPINSAFIGLHMHAQHGHGHGHLIHHHHHNHDPSSSSSHNHHNIIIPSSNTSNGTSTITTTNTTPPILEEDDHDHEHHHHTTLHGNINDDDDDNGNMYGDNDDMGMMKNKMKIKYKECQKNHAASMGGNARDGCGEFMPSTGGGQGSSLICSVCNCHRNFHRKEIQGQNNLMLIHQPSSSTLHYSPFYPSSNEHFLGSSRGRRVISGNGGGTAIGLPRVPFSSRSVGVNMPYTTDQSLADHHHGGGGGGGMMMMMHHHNNNHNNNSNQVVKKRFRTKFSQEQKEKMYEFAEKVGWKIQKQEENVVQQFCQQIGIKRRVLKVWMHNNKNNLAKKNYENNDNTNIINNSS